MCARLTAAGSLSSTISAATATSFRDDCSGTAIRWSPLPLVRLHSSGFAQQEFDLVLLDVLMPDMNGIELLLRLRADRRWQRIPVIMISGLNEVDAVARCIEAGADDYLPKPFNPVLLRARINSTLEKKRWLDREHSYLRRIEAEKQRADSLLRAILPCQIVARLQEGEQIIADRFEEATILFADIVGFSPIAARLPASDLVKRLGAMFSLFDELAEHMPSRR